MEQNAPTRSESLQPGPPRAPDVSRAALARVLPVRARVRASTFLLAGLAGLGLPAVARAQVDCSTLPSPVYLPATTDIRPALANLAPALSSSVAGADRLTVVYRSLSSCNATDYVRDDAALGGDAVYWVRGADGSPEERTCTIPAGVKADLAASDVSWQTCYGEAPPAGVGEWSGYVQTFLFVTPRSSTQQAITAEEAYFVLKFGGAPGRQVPPWTNPDFVLIRSPASSTQLVLGLAAGVPGTMWSPNLTNTSNGSGEVVSKVVAENSTGNAEATLGILSAQRYDRERDQVKGLAFQAFGQCLGAFYPDSTATSFDKANVRDGHYPIWAQLRLVARTGADGRPRSAAAATLIDVLRGTREVPGVDAVGAAIRAGAVPECAMHVQRDYDGGPLSEYRADAPCDCAFEAGVVDGRSSCTPCSRPEDCSAGVCRRGWCEAR